MHEVVICCQRVFEVPFQKLESGVEGGGQVLPCTRERRKWWSGFSVLPEICGIG